MKKIFARLEKLGSDAALLRATDAVSRELLKLIDECFQGRRDPYGNPWAKTKQHNPILERTGRMRHGWSVLSVSSKGFTVGNSQDYTRFHQRGTRYLPIRRMVPDPGAMPAAWRKRLTESAKKSLLEAS